MLLAVGILVDGAIIVVEYADRKMTEGHPPKQAFAEAALRMFWPVVSATATMIGAFLPMLLWPGIPGKFMSYFPITLIIILSCVDDRGADLPARAGRLLRQGAAARRSSMKKPSKLRKPATGATFPGITGWYAHLAEWLTRNPGRVMLGALGMVVVVIALFIVFNKGVEFFVDSDPD